MKYFINANNKKNAILIGDLISDIDI